MTAVLPRRVLMAAAGVAAFAAVADAEPSLELGATLDKFGDALRAGDAATAARLFTGNGSYMAPGKKTVMGQNGLQAAFRQILAAEKVNLDFDASEAAKYAEVGWLRGTVRNRFRILASGKEATAFYHLLAVFAPEAGVWKIRSYAYAPAPPEPAQWPK